MSIDPNTQIQPQEVPSQKTPDANHAQLRKGFEQERAARLAAEERIAHLEQAAKRPSYEQEDDSEPYVDSKKLNRKFAEFEENFEKKVEKKAEHIARNMVEQERQNAFLKANPDFQQILTPDILQKFIDKHPEMAEPMLEMPDNFARQKLLYQNIKALGIHRPPSTEMTIQQKVDSNRKSPYYQPSGGNAPPYAATGDFSKSGQKAAYEKMGQLINGRRGG